MRGLLAEHKNTRAIEGDGEYVDCLVTYELPQDIAISYEFGELGGSFDLIEISVEDENHKGEEDETVAEGFVLHEGSAHMIGEVAESVVENYDDARDRALNAIDQDIEIIE